jgi:hypothetical protein
VVGINAVLAVAIPVGDGQWTGRRSWFRWTVVGQSEKVLCAVPVIIRVLHDNRHESDVIGLTQLLWSFERRCWCLCRYYGIYTGVRKNRLA